MLAYVWPHPLIRIWLLAGLALTLYFVIRAALDYFDRLELIDEERPPGGDDVVTDA